MNILELNPLRIGMEIPRINICPYCGGRERTVAGIPPLSFSARMRAKLVRLTQYGLCEQKPVNYLASVTQTGKCEQNGTPTPSSPVDIKCNNGTIKVSRNLCDVNSTTARIGYYIAADGTVTSDSNNWFYQGFIPVAPSTTYTLSFSQSVYFVSISEYSSAADSGFVVRKSGATGSNTKLTITTDATTKFIRFGTNFDRTPITLDKVLAVTWMLTETEEALPYRPYKQVYVEGTPEIITDANGNTASAVNLLGAGDYADTQEVISGAVARKVVVKVFDGTESITGHSSIDGLVWCYTTSAKTGNDLTGVSSHYNATSSAVSNMQDGDFRLAMVSGENQRIVFRDTTNAAGSSSTAAANFKSFLAAQYAAGTPVIVVYPLATETTESVAGQVLAKAPLTVTAEVSNPTITTTEAPVSTPDPVHPLPIWCNNGELKLSPNLLDPSTSNIVIGQYYSANGTSVGGKNNWRTGLIPITGGRTYAFYGRKKADNTISAYNRINWYEADGTHIAPRPSYTVNTVTIATAPSNAAFAGLSCSAYDNDADITRETFDEFNWMFAEAAQEIPYVPYGAVYADGTPEVLTVSRKNLYNPASAWLFHTPIGFGGGAAWPNAEPSTYPNSITYFLRVKPNTTYTYSCATAGDRFGVCGENSVIDPSVYTTADKLNFDSIIVPLKSSSIGKTYTFTTGANTQMIAVYCALNTVPTNIQIEEGSTATAYEPYVTPQTASVEALLGVGDYKEEQEVLSGLIGRKVGLVIFDGTENWVKAVQSGERVNFGFYVDATGPSTTNEQNLICNIATASSNAWDVGTDKIAVRSNKNFNFINPSGYTKDSDVSEWTTFLASRYAAGDPVIVIYPLATPTTEQVEPQELYANKGENTLSIQANVDGIEVSLTYKD